MLEKNITKLFKSHYSELSAKGKLTPILNYPLSVTKVSRNLILFFTFRQTCKDILSRKSTEKKSLL